MILNPDAFKGQLMNNDTMPYLALCLENAEDVSFDTETSGLNVRNRVDYCMGWCFDVPGISCYMPMRHPKDNVEKKWWYIIWDILRDKDMLWHNRKFDFHSVATLGFDPLELKGFHKDGMMLASMVDKELLSKELDWLSKQFLKTGKIQGDVVHKLGEIYGYANLDPVVHKDYGSWDAVLHRGIVEYFWPRLVQQGLEGVYRDTESPFTTLLYKMEQRGVGTNPDLCSRKSSTGRSRMGTIQRSLGINPASPIDLKRVLLDELKLPVLKHTKSCEPCRKRQPVGNHEGPPSFDKAAMEDYDDILMASNNEIARLISEYRGWQKAVSSLWEPTLVKVGPDGLLRTEFHQHRTVTCRLSSSGPNLQQVPRGGVYIWNFDAKSAFTSGREGMLLMGWDYSQIEFRLGASYGSQTDLITAFNEGRDPFKLLAPQIFGVLTDETRQDTKTFTYANLFGAGPGKIALMLGRPLDETMVLYENFKRSIPGIIDISKQVNNLANQRGYIKYWDGSRRQFRNRSDSYKAWNSLLQGGAAQLLKNAMLRCEEFEDEHCFMVPSVHDEITFCIDEDKIHIYEPLIEHAMTDWPKFGINLAVAGKEWK